MARTSRSARKPEPEPPAVDAALLLRGLRTALSAEADPVRAEEARRYMKSEMPYHGVPLPWVRALAKALFDPLRFADAGEWASVVRALWTGARYREERYAAIALCRHRASRPFQTPEAMDLYEQMIVEGAWWDVVDEISEHLVGPIVRAYPEDLHPMMRAWSRGENLWKRRCAIICQRAFRQETDRELLYDCIAPSLGSKEFFLRKAIGWALREYARVDPAEVVRYVNEHRQQLSPLSVREALRNIRDDPGSPKP